MVRKYGKKNHVKIDPFAYTHILLGQSKVGKTTIVYQMLEKYLGEDGYIFLEMKREQGHESIEGIVAETVETWDKFEDIIDDIILNRTTDYADLKMVVIDTFDQLIELAEKKAVDQYNNILRSKGESKRVTSVNEVAGGYGRGLEVTIDLMLDKLWSLREVGVNFFIIGHVKTKDVIDPATQQTYQTLTSDMSQKYFNAIKNKAHFVGLAYVDRSIEQVSTGRKDSKGNTIMKGVATSDNRKISFRDTNNVMDSGSRFSKIAEVIEMDPDVLYNTYVEAIKAEQSKSTKSYEEAKAEEDAAQVEALKAIAKNEANLKAEKEKKELIDKVLQLSIENSSNIDFVTKVKEYQTEYNFTKIDEATLDILKAMYKDLTKIAEATK